jgi:hypothetical protein
MGNHEYAADSFEQYIVSKPSSLENIKKFSSNFIEGFVRGAKESVVGLVHFGKDCILHPINTVKEIYEVCSILHSLVRTNEWKTIGKALSPEVYELITNWEELQLEKRVELSGFAVGKYGTDVFAPGTLLKVGKSTIHDGKIIANLAKHLSASEKLLFIEAGIDSGAFSKAAKLENQSFYKQIADVADSAFVKEVVTELSEEMVAESIQKFKDARRLLKPHLKRFMPEERARELLIQAGIQPMPRPKGIPADYRVKIADNGAGLVYYHPTNNRIQVRVMAGKPHSLLEFQRKPYVKQSFHGKYYDEYGVLHPNEGLEEVHIPYEKFIYRE